MADSRRILAAGALMVLAVLRGAAPVAAQTWSTSDPTGDQPNGYCGGDLTSTSMDYARDLVTLSATTACGSNPDSSGEWRPGATDITWSIDTNGDNTADRRAVYRVLKSGRVGTVEQPWGGGWQLVCDVDPQWDGDRTFSLSFAPGCLGAGDSARVYTDMRWHDHPYESWCYCGHDQAPDGPQFGAVVHRAPPTRTADAAGYTLDGWGGLHGWSAGTHAAPPAASGGAYWQGWDIARGVGILSDGTGGYTLDGWGGMHPFALGANSRAPAVNGPYWSGWDIARGIAVMPNTPGHVRGFVLDGWGGLHWFADDSTPAPSIASAPYWQGWDIARGVTILPDGSGGYVLDGWGGVHPFAIGSGAAPAGISYGPYWSGWDIARGIASLPDGSGGFILDGWGGIHGYDISAGAQPIGPGNAAYWSGWDIARGVATLPS